MKAVATILLGLTLCPSVWAIDMQTIHGIHQACEQRPTGNQGEHIISTVEWYSVGVVDGYIEGYAEATSGLQGVPDTFGELHDAVCKYIDLHPEIWKLSRYKGMDLVLHTLYGRSPN